MRLQSLAEKRGVSGREVARQIGAFFFLNVQHLHIERAVCGFQPR